MKQESGDRSQKSEVSISSDAKLQAGGGGPRLRIKRSCSAAHPQDGDFRSRLRSERSWIHNPFSFCLLTSVSCLLLMILVVGAIGCGSLTNPFVHLKPDYTTLPADAMRQVAMEIEKAVQKEDREPSIADREGIVVNTPAIMQAIRMRAARSTLVNELLDTGHAIEGPNGTVAIVRTKDYKKATTGKQRDRNALVVMNENSDRWTLYEGIRKASRFQRRSLSAIQACFYEARVAGMAPGQKYKEANGQIAIKK